MTSDSLTIVFGYRNRDLIRVERCLQSLAGQTRRDFRVLFVDYGSRLSLARSVQSLVEGFPFCQYIYTDTRGWPWSRAKALNIGVCLAETDYVLTTDVDMIFAPNFVETVLKAQDGNSVIYCNPRWLPETFADWERIADYADALPKGNGQQGGCQCVPLPVMQAMRGFDENLEYWGAEDWDLNLRLMRWGLRECWVDDQTTIFHQWHPIERGGFPFSYLDRWINPYLAQVSTQLVRNTPRWGEIINREQRPLLDLLPEPETESIPDWPTLLARLARAVSAGDSMPRWLITDRPMGPGWSAAAQAGYQRAVITAPWVTYLLRTEEEIELQVEHLFTQGLAGLSGTTSTSSPGLIVVDVASFLRISRDIFVRLLETLAPGGFLVIANLREPPRLPAVMRWIGGLMRPLLGRIHPRLGRVSPKAQQRCYQAWMSLCATTSVNNLRDSLYLARVGVNGILDFTLEFSAAGTAIFLKGDRRSQV